jgi:hypothetical protein
MLHEGRFNDWGAAVQVLGLNSNLLMLTDEAELCKSGRLFGTDWNARGKNLPLHTETLLIEELYIYGRTI